MKLHEIYPSVDTVRTKLREELNQATKEKRMFADFISFMEYYISLCKDGTILNSKGGRLAAGTIQSYASTLKIVKQYCANRRIKLRLDGVTVNFYNDFVKFMNEEIDTVMTRVGYRSKIIWCGDYRQTDLNKKTNDMSGVLKFFDIAQHMSAFTRIEFTVDDIVRSSLVRDYIMAKLRYEDYIEGKTK